MKTLVSVLMPVRNGQAFLREAADSILSQSLRDFEFVVVDDGSTDATPAILADLAAADRRVVPLRTGGTGIVPALNLGLSRSTGAFVARMDADDVALPSRLATQADILTRTRGLVALGSAATAIDAKGRTLEEIRVPTQPADVRAALARSNPVLHPTVMMRRHTAVEAGGYRAALTYAEDYDLWLRLARRGAIANLAAPLTRLRRHGGQISTQRRLEQRAATALARLLDAGRGTAGGDLSVSLHAALTRFLLEWGESRPRLAAGEAKDLAVMLRVANRARLLTRGEVRSLALGLVAAGAGAGLPLKLLLRR